MYYLNGMEIFLTKIIICFLYCNCTCTFSWNTLPRCCARYMGLKSKVSLWVFSVYIYWMEEWVSCLFIYPVLFSFSFVLYACIRLILSCVLWVRLIDSINPNIFYDYHIFRHTSTHFSQVLLFMLCRHAILLWGIWTCRLSAYIAIFEMLIELVRGGFSPVVEPQHHDFWLDTLLGSCFHFLNSIRASSLVFINATHTYHYSTSSRR